MAGQVVMSGERVADENGVGAGGVECAVGFDGQVVGRQDAAATQMQWLAEVDAL